MVSGFLSNHASIFSPAQRTIADRQMELTTNKVVDCFFLRNKVVICFGCDRLKLFGAYRWRSTLLGASTFRTVIMPRRCDSDKWSSEPNDLTSGDLWGSNISLDMIPLHDTTFDSTRVVSDREFLRHSVLPGALNLRVRIKSRGKHMGARSRQRQDYEVVHISLKKMPPFPGAKHYRRYGQHAVNM